MLPISVTFDTLKLCKSSSFNPVALNIRCMSVTLDVSKLLMSKCFNDSVYENISLILSTFDVLKCVKSKLVIE